MMLCLAATVPQLHAQTYTVAGTPAAVLGTEWDPSNTSNDMVRMGSTTYYYLNKTANVNSGSYQFKVALNHSWGTAYPSNNYNYSVSSSGTQSIVYIFNTSGNAVSVFGPFKTLTVAGSQTELLGSSWGQTDANNDMTTNDGVNYTLSFTDVNVTQGPYQFKVVQDHAWTNAWPGSNYNYSINFTGVADVVFSFNVITKDVNVNVTEKSVTPVTPNYYITGDGGLVPSGWSFTPTTAMTYDENNDVYTYSYNVTTAGTYYFAFADGAGGSWDDFNANHRYAPNSGNVEVNVDGTWVTTQKGSSSYYITVDPGQVTITFDANTPRFKVVGTAPTAPVDYYVVGEDTNLFPNGWSTGTENLMIDNNGTYTWTANNVHLVAGTNYEYKVLGSDNSWHPSGNNATFSVADNGTYNVVFTFDGTNVNAVPTLVQADPTYTYDIYVRYTGEENVSNVFIYAWDAVGNLSDAWDGSTGGTALSNLTTQEVNGFTYYHVTYTSYSTTIGVIFNENGSGDTKTADLTALPGNNYFTYGGGSNVTGPMTQPDVPDFYVVGENTSIFPNGWSIGSETHMTEDNGTYTWTVNNIHLAAGTYDYKVTGTNGSWYPADDNASFQIDANGTYNVVFTFDGTNVNAVATLIQADPIYTYDIYVRYDGTEPIGNVYLYAWDSNGTLSDAWEGSTGGTSLSSLTSQVINGFTYYHVTYTSYDTTIGVIFNENGSSSTQTANLTAEPGTSYFTYGGGNTVDGPNDEADSRPDMYLIGYANTQQWASNAGIKMSYNETTGIYTLDNVVLTAMSNFAFTTKIGADNDDWDTVNAHRLSSNGESNWAITEEFIGEWMSYVPYSTVGENHNWFVDQQGAYTIEVDPTNHKVRVSRSNPELYIGYGVNWNWQDNSQMLTTVDGIVYQTTITLNQGDYFLFTNDLNNGVTWGANNDGYEINDFMVNYAQTLNQNNSNNYHFVGTTGKYVVVVNLEKKTVTLRRTADGGTKTQTKIYLQKTSNVELDPAGGTYQGQTLDGKRGGIYSWNKLNLKNQEGRTYEVAQDGPTNYTYEGEVMIDGQNYVGNGYLNDMNDTTTVDGKEWYAWSVSNSICEFYFIRKNNANDLKSQIIMRRSGEIWLTWIDEDATTNRQPNAQHCDSLLEVTRNYYQVSSSGVSDCETMLEDHYYVYYTNTTGWDSVYCYAWYEVGDNVVEFTRPYPGSKCTFVGYDEDGYEVWCYDFGLIEDFDHNMIPTNVIFDNGLGGGSEGEAGDNVRQQTGDLVFSNGACYDYLGLIYLGNSLSAIINSGVVNGPKYTVEDDLVGVYYDKNAVTQIPVYDQSGELLETVEVHGALYAKDMDNYAAKSRMPDGTTDYVYGVCAHTKTATYPGGSQIQLKRTDYDQSNWVKIVISPNFDNANAKSNGDVNQSGDFDTMTFEDIENDILDPYKEEHYLDQYVGRIIPGRTMSGNIVNNVNPQMHITNIARPGAEYDYEKNVYITPHFNDTVVFSYVHQDWNPGTYNGVYKAEPIMGYDQQGNQIIDTTIVDKSTLYKMFYVAPKPQEVAYITWAVFVHDDPNHNIGTEGCISEPDDPGAFYVPMNWNRKGQLWDGTNPNDPNGAWGTTYGPFSNGYMQYAAFKVNWSLFEDMEIPFDPSDPNAQQGREQEPWYRIFKPGQAYKIMAIIRYAHGEKLTDVEYMPGVYKGNGYNDGNDPDYPDHVSNAPRRSNSTWADLAVAPYKPESLANSKFIVFPLKGSSEDSNGNDLGNVTTVNEVKAARTEVSKRYYNLMGVESDKPFSGLNIIVTTYSDGSRSSSKVLMR